MNSEHGSSASPAIEATHLRKSFGKVQAVKDVSLTVQPGEVVAVLGPNGAGKTSTIDLLLGLSKPDAGSVKLFGMTPRAAIGRGLVAAVMQTGGLLKDITVRDTLVLTASLFANAMDIDQAMERAGITSIAKRKIEKCSGGQQQRLRFAMALLSDPGLLMLDEPTTGMDVEGRRSFWDAIHTDASRGRTVLFATHYLDEADQYADRIVLMREGEIVADGTGAEIKAMASGRTITAIIPDGTELPAFAPEVEVEHGAGNTVMIHAKDSDAALRTLVANTDAHDITVTSHNLEQAFLKLTAAGAAPADKVGAQSGVTQQAEVAK